MFSERGFTVEIEDEAGGEFVVVASQQNGYNGKVAIDVEDWPALREAIDRMMKECRSEEP